MIYPAGYWPRRSEYGKPSAYKLGLSPLGDYPQKVIPRSDWKDAIEESHRLKIQPIYHEAGSWRKEEKNYNQDGLPYCWAWGAASTMMNARACSGKSTILLAPVTLGWLVDWRDQGYFLDETLAGVRQRGIASREFVPDQHNNSPSSFRDGWEEDALKHRFTGDIYDTDSSNKEVMAGHIITLLCAGIPLYVAYMWWGHALQKSGVRWKEGAYLNLEWADTNSHNETEPIWNTGEKWVPYEAYGVPSTLYVED